MEKIENINILINLSEKVSENVYYIRDDISDKNSQRYKKNGGLLLDESDAKLLEKNGQLISDALR